MDISTETFARIIQATASGVNWEQFGVAVAINDPDLFVRVLEDVTSGWIAEAKQMQATGANRPTVSKFIRSKTGMGLKDSLDWIEENMPFEKVED